MSRDQTLAERCKQHLAARWDHTTTLCAEGEPPDFLEDQHALLGSLVGDCLTSTTKSYHYVLPTQILCKVVDPSLDAHSLQAAWGVPGAFDARTVAHKVIVPFDQQNERVLGGSPEPYVNNPLRYPAVIPEYRAHQKNKRDWDKLIAVLDLVEETQDQGFTESLFDQILVEIYRLLEQAEIIYATPNRISLNRTHVLLAEYLSERSGGHRMEAVGTALFRTIGQQFAIFDDVRHGKVTAADASSGMAADIECWLAGRIVLLAEVKDRTLTLTQLDARLDSARAQRISEILFIAQGGKQPTDADAIDDRVNIEFASGQNVYISNFFEFSLGILILLGERGRVDFLANVGKELDSTSSPVVHRRAWAQLLKRS